VGDPSIRLESFRIADNRGVGLGVASGARGIIIYNGSVERTGAVSLPALVDGVSAGAREVGDGLNWLDGSGAELSDVTIAASARASFLIDGETAPDSRIERLTQTDGDEQAGIVQQGVEEGGAQPTVEDGPDIAESLEELFAVPAAPTPPVQGL
jgi:hypothetical protein